MISGILPVDKPLGWTSHDVVARVRRVAKQRQVGHAGTLDPLATGLLLLVLGNATRLSSYVMDSPKVYCADVVLGVTTVTDDAEAPILERRECQGVSRADVERCLAGFVGDLMQTPPMYAAVRHGGEKLYVLARKGETVERSPRRVTIDAIEIERWVPPCLRIRVRCAPGTYIRSLARDLGAALGTGAYLHALRRLASGSFSVNAAHPLPALNSRDAIQSALQPPDWAVLDWPALVLTPDEERAVQDGNAIRLGHGKHENVRLYGPAGMLVGLGECDGDRIKPFRVFETRSEADANRRRSE